MVISTFADAGPQVPGGSVVVKVSFTLVSPGAGVYTAFNALGFEKVPLPPVQVPPEAPLILPASFTGCPAAILWFGPALTLAAASIVTLAVANFDVPSAKINVLVTVYVPGLLALRFICPVVLFTKSNPLGEALNAPAVELFVNMGKGFAALWQNGPL